MTYEHMHVSRKNTMHIELVIKILTACLGLTIPMIGENQQLVTNEPVEFEK